MILHFSIRCVSSNVLFGADNSLENATSSKIYPAHPVSVLKILSDPITTPSVTVTAEGKTTRNNTSLLANSVEISDALSSTLLAFKYTSLEESIEVPDVEVVNHDGEESAGLNSPCP